MQCEAQTVVHGIMVASTVTTVQHWFGILPDLNQYREREYDYML